ncbi:hypothetical protein NEOLEDRAFT_1131635 [Neolentinus lepideus HHB14362 ss-1]|uniref:Uncharacterized protein n=1 Tax=Neolentinus lepideus HHB14362 ss-1 TaxID=1314782 RepID=A0A165TH12_9AGAM|nr:hypothetical protein NEOLEDRAFT_1131635 [Neolentinus lepideus HHB14362 ss-1]
MDGLWTVAFLGMTSLKRINGTSSECCALSCDGCDNNHRGRAGHVTSSPSPMRNIEADTDDQYSSNARADGLYMVRMNETPGLRRPLFPSSILER